MKIGLVLEGGGMRGIYTVGVLDTLLNHNYLADYLIGCLLYTSPSPRDGLLSRMPSSA